MFNRMKPAFLGADEPMKPFYASHSNHHSATPLIFIPSSPRRTANCQICDSDARCGEGPHHFHALRPYRDRTAGFCFTFVVWKVKGGLACMLLTCTLKLILCMRRNNDTHEMVADNLTASPPLVCPTLQRCVLRDCPNGLGVLQRRALDPRYCPHWGQVSRQRRIGSGARRYSRSEGGQGTLLMRINPGLSYWGNLKW